jgi:hypothetical protein
MQQIKNAAQEVREAILAARGEGETAEDKGADKKGA